MAETTNKEKTIASEVTKEAKKSEATSKAVEKKSTAAKKETKAVEVDKKAAEAAVAVEDTPEMLASDVVRTDPDEEKMSESVSESSLAQESQNDSNEVKDVTTEPLQSTEVEQVEVVEQKFPFTHVLTHPVTIYRAPAGSFAGISFCGVLIITGEDVSGFTPVKLYRSGIGIEIGYVRTVDLQ